MTRLAAIFGMKAKVVLGAIALAAGLATITPVPAEAQGWDRGYGRPVYAPRAARRGPRHRARRNNGAAIAAGIIGGIAAGALIAGATRRARAAETYHYGYGHPGYAYPAPRQAWRRSAPVHAPGYVSPAYPYGRGYGGAAHAVQPPYRQGCYYRMVREHVGGNHYAIRQVQMCE